MSKAPLMLAALVALVAWAAKRQAPELQRYLRVRRM